MRSPEPGWGRASPVFGLGCFFAQGEEMLLSGRATSGKKVGGVCGFWGKGVGGRGEGRLLRAAWRDEKFRAARRRCCHPHRHPAPPPPSPAFVPRVCRPPAPSPLRGTRWRPPGGQWGGGPSWGGGGGRCPLGHCFFSLIPGAAELRVAGRPCGRGRRAGLDPAFGG